MSKPRKKRHEQTMWIIKKVNDPDGVYLCAGSVEYRKRSCIGMFASHFAPYSAGSWEEYRKDGYRCVKVKITEV